MARARSFSALISLLRRAERSLAAGGITDPEQQLIALRGLYYGTAWSRDFRTERSQIRNLGFIVFTGFGVPPDPRTALGTRLFADLQASQDVRDRGRLIDVGHTLIGMEARLSRTARSVPIPEHGGTGLEIVTWLGDLGGGAANLAWKRSAGGSAARRSVSGIFSSTGSDYGASINLEGDLAGYLVGTSAGAGLAAPSLSSTRGVADTFEEYLPVSSSATRRYGARARDFLSIMGARFASGGSTISNRAKVISDIAAKIADFSEPYMLQRYILGQGRPRTRVLLACKHRIGAAEEIAEVFVAALESAIGSTGSPAQGAAPWPTPSAAAADCTSTKLNIAALEREATELITEGYEESSKIVSYLLGEVGLD